MTDKTVFDFSTITSIMFDMDGTLIEHTWQLDRITHTLFSRFENRLGATHDEFYAKFWDKNMDMWFMMVDGVLDGDTAARYSYINTLRAMGQDTALAGEMLSCWNELVLGEAVPFEDTYRVLDKLRHKYLTGIITNGFTSLQRAKIETHKLAQHVDFTLVSEEAGYHKPDKRIFLRALQLANNILPQQALYVGDNLDTDVAGAKAAGLTPVLIDPYGHRDDLTGVIQIQRLSDLLDLLPLSR